MSRVATNELALYPINPGDWERLLTPTLVVFLQHVRGNIQRVLQDLGGDPGRWRPHVKTAKIPVVLEQLADAGIRHFKCATTREADVLLATMAGRGIHDCDLLVAYPHVGPALLRLAGLARRHSACRIAVLCEDPAAVSDIPPQLGIFVDINPGMNRSGVPMSDRKRIADIARRTAGRFRGIHFYEGHVSRPDPERRRHETHGLYNGLMNLVSAIAADGISVPEVVTSGTPTYRHALAYAPFREIGPTCHRVSPGTVVYHDGRSDERVPGLGLTAAAIVVSRVISHPADDVVTCDAGSKAIAAEAGDPCVRVVGRPDLCALGPTEEHLPLRVMSGDRPPRGHLLVLVPRHVCPTVNLAEEAVIMDGAQITGIVPVAARAHETRLET